MDFNMPPSSFMPSPFVTDSDVSDSCTQFSMTNAYSDTPSQFVQNPPFKKLKFSEENQSNIASHPHMIPQIPASINAPINNKLGSNIFFKTRLCTKFKVGQCRNGENCNFAHGIEDIRQPPPNWQELAIGRDDDYGIGNQDDDQRIIHKMKLCKKFYNGEPCPYGERCNFLHEDPKKFRDDSGRSRENLAISIGTNAPSISGHENVAEQPDSNKFPNNGVDAYRSNMRPVYFKTKLCCRFEATGLCPFAEKCHFAHGHSELQLHGARVEGEIGIPCSIPVISVPYNEAPLINNKATDIVFIQEASDKKRLLKWKGTKKINRIYGDWIDDLPIVNA